MTKKFSKLMAIVLVIAMAISMNTVSAFAQEVPANSVTSTKSITLLGDATYINGTDAVTMAYSPNDWTYLSLNLPSYVPSLYVQTSVYDRGNIDSLWYWEIKRPGGNWETLESMCIGDYSAVVNIVTVAFAGTYEFRVRQQSGGTSGYNKECRVVFWK